MSSIFDMDPNDLPKRGLEESPKKRGKEREALTPAELLRGKRRLSEMVEGAFETLEQARREADWPTAIKAAQIILDRAGFGPKSTVDVNSTSLDLTALTREQLADRAAQLANRLQKEVGSRDVKHIM